NGGLRVDPATEPALTSGDTVADRYLVQTQVPTDIPHAVSWLGRDEILRRQVEVTILGGPHSSEALDAARRASVVQDDRLQHVRREGHHEELSYVVTDPVHGRSLTSLLAEGPLPPEQARSMIGQAALAIATARKRGVHHLRLRPDALRLSYAAEVVVAGLAIDAAQAGTHLEQASAAAREDSVDLVRLLYTALTGSWPGRPELAGDLPLAERTDAAPVAPAGADPARTPAEHRHRRPGGHRGYRRGRIRRRRGGCRHRAAGHLGQCSTAHAGPRDRHERAAAGDHSARTPGRTRIATRTA